MCPDEGICQQKVISRYRFGHTLLCKFVMSCRSRNSKVDKIPCTLESVRQFCFDYGAFNCVQEREMEDSRRILYGFCSLGSLKERIHHLRGQGEIARTSGGVLYA